LSDFHLEFIVCDYASADCADDEQDNAPDHGENAELVRGRVGARVCEHNARRGDHPNRREEHKYREHDGHLPVDAFADVHLVAFGHQLLLFGRFTHCLVESSVVCCLLFVLSVGEWEAGQPLKLFQHATFPQKIELNVTFFFPRKKQIQKKTTKGEISFFLS